MEYKPAFSNPDGTCNCACHFLFDSCAKCCNGIQNTKDIPKLVDKRLQELQQGASVLSTKEII